jgi:periodic tryptophan protein 1
MFCRKVKFPTKAHALVAPQTHNIMSMITATTWVPRGFAAPFPTKYQFDEDEYDRISKLANLQLEDAKEDLEEAQAEAGGKSNGKSSKPSKKKDDE